MHLSIKYFVHEAFKSLQILNINSKSNSWQSYTIELGK